MDKVEATKVLAMELQKLRALSYSELVERLLDRQETFDIAAKSGARYQIELQGFWDDQPGGDLRVVGAIDDGGWRAFVPLCDGFIIAPDGSFVDE